jgi:hypothetical protein
VRQIGDCFAIFGVFYPVPYTTAHVRSPFGIWLPFTALVPSKVAAYGNLLHTGCLCLPGSIYGGKESAKLGHCLPPPNRESRSLVKWKLICWSTLVFEHAISYTCGHCG